LLSHLKFKKSPPVEATPPGNDFLAGELSRAFGSLGNVGNFRSDRGKLISENCESRERSFGEVTCVSDGTSPRACLFGQVGADVDDIVGDHPESDPALDAGLPSI
jgi:hypothetical protein